MELVEWHSQHPVADTDVDNLPIVNRDSDMRVIRVIRVIDP